MVSRRAFVGMAASLTSAAWLRAQDAQRPVYWVKLSFTVTDSHAKYINGLKPSDFRVLEDGIRQKISTFAEGSQPPVLVNEAPAEAGKPGTDLSREDLDNSYTITYYPDPSNHNQGFRKIDIEIVADAARQWRVRKRPGYRARN